MYTFSQQISEVFAHLYSDIIQYLETINFDVLIDIRKKLYDSLPDNLSIGDKELISRRKKSNLADDIYLLGYSLVSEMEHKRLKKIFKHKSSPENDETRENELSQESSGDLSWLTLYVEMKNTLKELKNQVKELTQKVTYLETELILVKQKKETGKNDQSTSIKQDWSGNTGK